MDQSTQFNQPPVASPKRSSALFVIIGFLVLVVVVGVILGALAWQKNPALFAKINPFSKPSPAPVQTEVLPIPLSQPLVVGASVSYRLSGTIAEVNQSPDGSLSLKLANSQGQLHPNLFTVAKDRTVVSLKTGGFAATPSAELKTGEKVELIYLVDLKSKESLVTQVQIK